MAKKRKVKTEVKTSSQSATRRVLKCALAGYAIYGAVKKIIASGSDIYYYLKGPDEYGRFGNDKRPINKNYRVKKAKKDKKKKK